MSEIFDFLKKAEAERRKTSPATIAVPIIESENAVRAEPAVEPGIEEPLPTEVEICSADKFDLTNASRQIKSVLDPLTLVGEQFRLLRSRLGLLQKQRGVKTVLVTSSVPEEGKTFIASGLAGVFAQEPGKRVVLIDADMRKPKSGWNFGLNGSSGSMGLSEVLSGKQDFHGALFMSLNPQFYFMPSGPLPTNPSELLSTRNLERTLQIAAESFDWIIIDSPPVLALSDTTLLTPLCDTVIMVVRANSTASKLVLDAINRIGRERISGIVLNRQKQAGSSRYYYKYYYRGSKRDKE